MCTAIKRRFIPHAKIGKATVFGSLEANRGNKGHLDIIHVELDSKGSLQLKSKIDIESEERYSLYIQTRNFRS